MPACKSNCRQLLSLLLCAALLAACGPPSPTNEVYPNSGVLLEEGVVRDRFVASLLALNMGFDTIATEEETLQNFTEADRVYLSGANFLDTLYNVSVTVG